MVSASSSRPATPTSFSTTVSTTASCPSCCRWRHWISCSRKRLLRRVTSSRSISRRSASSRRAVMHSSSKSTRSANINCSTASTTSVSPCSTLTRSRRMNNAAASRRRGCFPDRSTTHRIFIGTTDMTNKIAVLAGDGIGPEIVAEAMKVLDVLRDFGFKFEAEHAPIGGAGYDAAGDPLPDASLKLAQQADAVLLGAVGGPKYDTLPRDKRPERGLLRIRKELNLIANLRPALLYFLFSVVLCL